MITTSRRYGLIAAGIALALIVSIESPALAAAQEPASRGDGWMPDVAERVEDLRRRTERDARPADAQAEIDDQWWRSVAAAPALGRLP